MIEKLFAAFAWSLVAGIALFSSQAMADQRPGCLPTDPGTVTWTLPTVPTGPSWTFTALGIDLANVSGEFRATFWRRPCNASDSQIILTLEAVSGSPMLGLFGVFQSGSSGYWFDMAVNDPSQHSSNTYVLSNTFVGGAISGVLDNIALNDFDPNAAFTLSYTPTWPVGAPPTALDIPAYDPSQYSAFPPPAGVNLNQRGLSGTWYDPQTSGQGFVIEVAPDYYGAGIGLLFGGWYTYDAHASNTQRWYTLQGQVSSGSSTASIPIYLTQGGNFDAVGSTTTTTVGQSTLSFSDCNHGTLRYTFSDGSGRSGAIPLTRLLPNPSCQL